MSISKRFSSLSFAIGLLLCVGLLSACQSVQPAKLITALQYGATPNDGKDDSDAINDALFALNTGDTLFFPAGVYDLDKPLKRDRLDNNTIAGEAGSILRKSSRFKGEYIFYIRFSKNVTVEGLTFEGLTKDTDIVLWGEQGLYMGSTRGSRIRNNTFRDFGDACLRMTTSSADRMKGVNSYNALVEHNRFINCTQVTTTQVVEGYGGTENITAQWNYFDGLKGSLKFCSREPVSNGRILNNIFAHGKGNAIEVCSYGNIEVAGNYIVDNQKYAMNFYENRPFPWDNHWVHDNVVDGSLAGIGFWGLQINSGYGSINDVKIENNCFANIRGGAHLHPGVIRLTSNHPTDSYDGVQVVNNHFYQVIDNQLLYIRPTALNVFTDDNTVIPYNCAPQKLAMFAEPDYWLKHHNSPTYQTRWINLIDQLSD